MVSPSLRPAAAMAPATFADRSLISSGVNSWSANDNVGNMDGLPSLIEINGFEYSIFLRCAQRHISYSVRLEGGTINSSRFRRNREARRAVPKAGRVRPTNSTSTKTRGGERVHFAALIQNARMPKVAVITRQPCGLLRVR